MHFPYTSGIEGASWGGGGMKGDGPVDGRPVPSVCLLVSLGDSGTSVDGGSSPRRLAVGVLLCLTAEGREL